VGTPPRGGGEGDWGAGGEGGGGRECAGVALSPPLLPLPPPPGPPLSSWLTCWV